MHWSEWIVQKKNFYIFVVYRVRVWGIYKYVCARYLSPNSFHQLLALRNFSEECARIHGIANYCMCMCVCVRVHLYLCIAVYLTMERRWLRHIVSFEYTCVWACIVAFLFCEYKCVCVLLCDSKRHRNQLQSFPFDHIHSVY